MIYLFVIQKKYLGCNVYSDVWGIWRIYTLERDVVKNVREVEGTNAGENYALNIHISKFLEESETQFALSFSSSNILRRGTHELLLRVPEELYEDTCAQFKIKGKA